MSMLTVVGNGITNSGIRIRGTVERVRSDVKIQLDLRWLPAAFMWVCATTGSLMLLSETTASGLAYVLIVIGTLASCPVAGAIIGLLFLGNDDDE